MEIHSSCNGNNSADYVALIDGLNELFNDKKTIPSTHLYLEAVEYIRKNAGND